MGSGPVGDDDLTFKGELVGASWEDPGASRLSPKACLESLRASWEGSGASWEGPGAGWEEKKEQRFWYVVVL